MSEIKTLTLPALVREAGEIAALLAENGGELTPELETLIDKSGQALAAKCDSYGFILQALEAQEQMASQRKAEWDAFLKATERAKANLKYRLLAAMQALNVAELAGDQSTFRLQANPPSVVIEELSKLPAEFIVIEPPPPLVQKIDKKAIADAIKSGREVPGARIERSVRLIHKVGARRIGS
jgi:hypothetical protein